jgi:hypothetical protein
MGQQIAGRVVGGILHSTALSATVAVVENNFFENHPAAML